MTERSDDASGADPGQGRAPGPPWTERADTGSRADESRSGRRRDHDESRDSRESRDTRGAREAEGGHGIGHSLLMFLKEVVIVVVLAVVLSLVLKTWFVQSFWIPSGSMNNTLVRDDRVSVSKLTPGPFDLNRGDIVVFADPGGWLTDAVPPQQGPVAERINSALTWVGLLPNDEGNHLIKRVIGLPGDHVQCCNADGRLLVNGTPVTEPYVYPGDTPSDLEFDITVPAGKVWVMGDHRSNSRDSRYNDAPEHNGTNGSVPIDMVVGRAFAVVWPLSKLTWLGEPEGTFTGVPAPTAEPVQSSSRPAAAVGSSQPSLSSRSPQSSDPSGVPQAVAPTPGSAAIRLPKAPAAATTAAADVAP
ncbi:signal peptidase I [Piscicoccus intestinalis]|uniref:signal peptidase I n=1 Tax=Piscicoccus intestinalis TaxID=746033 RepID=UPI000A01AB56|nr:signal peptidase I [Piscicoccus intestinalis]